MTYRKLFFSLLAVALLVVATGCDSNGDDDESDAEVFIGAWAATGISDATGDQTASFAQSVSQFVVTFTADTYGLNVVFADARDPIVFSGATYSVDEDDNELTIVIPAEATGATAISLTFDYAFLNNNDTVTLTNSAQVAFVNLLFGTTYEAPVTVTLARQ